VCSAIPEENVGHKLLAKMGWKEGDCLGKTNDGILEPVSYLSVLCCFSSLIHSSSFTSRMRVMNHNWSATKQRLHPQSVAEISCHSVLSGDRIRQCETSSGSRHKDTDQCL